MGGNIVGVSLAPKQPKRRRPRSPKSMAQCPASEISEFAETGFSDDSEEYGDIPREGNHDRGQSIQGDEAGEHLDEDLKDAHEEINELRKQLRQAELHAKKLHVRVTNSDLLLRSSRAA